MADQGNRGPLISEIRQRFETEYLPAKRDKYDSRDIERLHQDDTWVDNFLIWRDDIVDDTLKMIDESFQWRKEYAVHASQSHVIALSYVPHQLSTYKVNGETGRKFEFIIM